MGISVGVRLAAAIFLAVLSCAAIAFTTPPSIDNTPPVITTVPQAVYVSDGIATIRWVTDEIADSTVTYGLVSAALSIIGADVERKTEHLITVMGLAPSTTYSFAVASTDPSGNTVTSTGFSFTTVAAPDTTPPSFAAGPTLANITASSVEITWSAGEPSNAVVAYGTSAGTLNQQSTSAEFKTEHAVTLTNLSPSTTYFVVVTATDLAGNPSTSATLSYATLAPPPTAPIGVGATLNGGNNIVIGWNLVSGATGYNIYMANATGVTKTNYASLAGGHVHMNVSSPFTHASAAPGTYYLVVTAVNAAGESVESAQASATVTGTAATAPGAPTSVSASPGNTQATVSFSAPSSNGGAAIASYMVTSSPGGITATGAASPLTVTGLTNGTAYTFTVTATNSAGSGVASAASNSVTPLSTNPSFTPVLVSGFNLLGNSLNTTLNVMTIFGNQTSAVSGITDNIASVWKWDAGNSKWQFHSPLLTTAANVTYASAHNYDILTSVAVGEGYWINALTDMVLPPQTGVAFNWNSVSFANLPSGFNLIAHASNVTPSQFNHNVTVTASDGVVPPPSPGVPAVVPTDNFASLWAWDATNTTWFFYSPLLESSGGLPAVKAYADSHSFLHFQDFNKKIDIGVGFWVNKF